MSAKYKSPSFLLPNEINTNTNPLNTDGDSATGTGVNSLYSMDFDSASSDYIDLGNNVFFDTNNPFTFSAWINLDSYTTNYPYIANLKTNVTDGFAIFLSNTGSYTGVNIGSTDSNITKGKTTGDISSTFLTSWNHIAVIYNGSGANTLSNYSIYINGSPVTLTTTGSFSTITNVNNLGRLGSGSFYFNGKIDEVAIFNRALDSTEIAALYGGTSPNIYPSNLIASNLNPIAYYPLGEQAQNSGYLSASGNEWQFPNGVLQDYVMDFDGTNTNADVINLGNLTFGEDFSFSLWFKYETANKMLFSSGSASNNSVWLQFDANNVWLGLGNGYIEKATGGLTTGKWYNIAVTVDNTVAGIYLNSSLLVSTGTVSSTRTNIGDNFTIGNYIFANNYEFDGQLSNFQIFNTALPATGSNSVETLYNNGSPLTSMSGFTSLTNWWKLNATSVYTPSAPNYTTALDFNGSSNYIDVTPSSTLAPSTGDFTFSGWFYRENLSGNPVYFEKGAAYPGNGILVRDSGATGLIEVYYNGFGGIQFSNLTSYNTSNAWHHIALVYSESGNTLTAYVDGNSEQKSATTTLNVTDSIFIIGKRQNNNDYWEGKISNNAIYNSALTSSQISTLFNFGTPETNISFSPQAWWKLDDQTAITDYSGNGNTGTNNGATDISSGVAVTPSWKIPTALTIPTINYTSALKLVGGTSSNPGESMAFASTISTTSTTSFSMWLKTTTTSNQYILTYLPSAPNGILFRNGKIYFFDIPAINATSYPQSNDISSTLADGNWHHLVVTRDNKNVKFYLDKNDVSTSTTFNLDFNSFDITHFGKASSNHGIDWNGEVSNLAIFNSVLSQANVETLYNNGQPQDNISFTPTHWWKLNSINGTTVTDTNGSNNGTTSGSIETTDVKTSDLNIPVNGVSTTLPSTALQQSDLQFDSPYSNYSLNFDGASSRVQALYNLPSGVTKFSVSIWGNVEGAGSSVNKCLISNESGNGADGYALFTEGNYPNTKVWFKIENNTSTQTTSNIVFGEWFHVLGTYDNGIAKIYFNGVLEDTTTGIPAINTSTLVSTMIGSYRESSPIIPMLGHLDEAAIWDTVALTDAQVLEIYNNGKPGNISTLSPTNWWRLGENAYFNNSNKIVTPNSIIGGVNGIGSGTVNDSLSADAPGTYANGIGTNLDIVDRVGDAALSASNSQSYNMIPSDISPYVPQYVGDQIANNFSMSFDGNDDYFDGGISSIFNLQGSFSVSLWVNSSSFQNYVHLLSKLDTSYTGWRIQLDQTNVRIQTSNMSGGITVAKNMNTATWYHMCFTYDGTYLNYYQNGSNAISNNTSFVSPPSSNNNNFRIGKSGLTDAGGAAHNGQIDEVAIFDTALNAGQIYNDIYQPTSTGTNQTADLVNNPNLPNPVAWYRMGD